MKVSGKRLVKYVEKEHGDTIELLKNTKSTSMKQKIKKQLNTRIRKHLDKWE